jgi:bifunctional polynucleotide phosphatase/kinase
MLPKLAFTSFASRYRAPKVEEGFGEIIKVDFEVSARLDIRHIGVRSHTY